MSSRRTLAGIVVLFCLMAPLGWNGCTERSREDAGTKAAAERDAGSADDTELDRVNVPFYPPVELGVVTGKIDGRNRYLSAVRVFAKGIGAPETVKLCSGVLVSPRLVLTAASCVCSQQQPLPGDGGQTLIDRNGCATIGSVLTTTYDPPTDGEIEGGQWGEYDGAVRVHPEFKQVVDEQGNVVSSEADLAVVVLDKAAKIPPVELAESDLNAGESLVVVGHGLYKGGSVERVFSEHRVTEVLRSGGRVVFVQVAPRLYKGALGAPCLRRTKQGLRLSGILSKSVGQEALFTSTYPFRDWVRAEIQGAADAGSSMPQPQVSP